MNNVKCNNRLCEKEYNVQFDNCPFCGAANPKKDGDGITIIKKEDNSSNHGAFLDGKKEFNGWISTIIWLSILVGGTRGIVNSFTYFTISSLIGWLVLGLHVGGMVILCLILYAKKWAVFAWVGYIVAVILINGYFGNDYLPYVIVGVLKLVFLFLILQIRKDGISAWSIIFNKKKVDPTNNDVNAPQVAEKHDEKKLTDAKNGNDSYTIKSEAEEEQAVESSDNKEVAPTIDSKLPADKETAQIEETASNLQKEMAGEELDSTQVKAKKGRSKNKHTGVKIGKWWIVPLIVVATLAIVWLFVWLSHRQTDSKLSKYIYVDEYSILHIDRNCDNIANVHGTKPIAIYSVNELTQENWKHVCSNCVSDNVYETISQKVIGNGNLRNVYNILVNEGYTPPDFSQFVMDMKDTSNLQGVKATLQKEGYIIPSFSQFMIDMGVDSTQPPIKMVGYEKCNLRELYDNLKKDGYNDIGTYQDFYNWCNMEGDQGIKNRKKLYKCLVNDNYDMPEYDTYIRDLFNIKFWGE